MLPFPILFALLLDHPLAASFRTESGATLHAWASKSFLNAFPVSYTHLDVYKRQLMLSMLELHFDSQATLRE